MSAPLDLHLVLNVHARNTGADILPHRACDIRGSSESERHCEHQIRCRVHDRLPRIGVRNDGDGGLQATDHLRGLWYDNIRFTALDLRNEEDHTPTKSFNVAIATSGCPSREAVVAAPLGT